MTLSPRFRAVLLGLLGVVILAVAAGILLFFTYNPIWPSPADSLSASRTLLYWNQVTLEDLRPWERYFPQLKGASGPTVPFDAALIGTSRSDAVWIMFPSENDPLMSQTQISKTGVPFLSDTPNPDVLFATETEATLAQSRMFRSLEGDVSGPSVYANLALLQPASDPYLDRLIGLTDAKPQAFMMTKENGAVRALWYGEDLSSTRGGARSVPSLSPAPAFSVTGDDIVGFVQMLPTTDDARLRSAQLAATIRTLAGDNVSMEFDILPLLAGPASLHLLPASGSDTHMDALLEGQMSDRELLARTVDRLHSGMTGSPSQTKIIPRLDPEDGTVVGKSVVTETEDIVTADETWNGWQLRATSLGEHGIYTAVRGGMFVISTRKDWLEQRLMGTTPSAAVPGSPARAGVVDLSLLRSLPHDSSSLTSLLLDILPPSGQIRWSTGVRGPVLTLTGDWQ